MSEKKKAKPSEIQKVFTVAASTGIVAALVGGATGNENILLFSASMLACSLMFYIFFCRCPHCHRILTKKATGTCPHCKKELP